MVPQAVGVVVGPVAEAEVAGDEAPRGVFERDQRAIVGAGRRIVDRRDVDRHRVGHRIQILAAEVGAAVVLHLEGESGVGAAVGVGGRREREQAGGDVAELDRGADSQHDAVEGQRAGRRRSRDPDRQQIVGRRVVAVGEREVGRLEDIGIVFRRGDLGIGAARRVVDRPHRDGDRIGGRIGVVAPIGRAAVVLNLEADVREVRVGAVDRQRREHQAAHVMSIAGMF